MPHLGSLSHHAGPSSPPPAARILSFGLHFAEMCIPCVVGFAVGDALYFLAADAAGYSRPFSELPALSVAVVTLNMTVPMVAWMRWRAWTAR